MLLRTPEAVLCPWVFYCRPNPSFITICEEHNICLTYMLPVVISRYPTAVFERESSDSGMFLIHAYLMLNGAKYNKRKDVFPVTLSSLSASS